MKFNRQYALWTLLVLALLGLTAAALFYKPGDRLLGGLTSRGGGEGGAASGAPAQLDDFGAVPAFTLVSQTGAEVQRIDLDGQVWIADFIFTSCKGTCPVMSSQMRRVDEMLATEAGVRLVSFTVDPERDTPEVLAAYGAQFGARPERWIFLTGEKDVLRELASNGFHLPASDTPPAGVAQGAEIITHSTRFVLVDREGRIRGYYSGIDAIAVEQLVRDTRQLLAVKPS